MSRFFLGVFLLVLSGCVIVSPQKITRESKPLFPTLTSMAEIKPYLAEADLVIFDIDHTILEAATIYCHSNWFYDRYEEALAEGISAERAIDALVPMWDAAQKNCPVKPVEAITPALIKEIQQSGKKVMALTSRSDKVALETIAQLKSLGIDFSSSAPAAKDFSLDMKHGASSKNGVMFTSDYLTKGDVLKKYLTITQFDAKNIIFIDDSKTNLTSVSEVLSSNQVKVSALFYPLVKRNEPYWNKALAQQEWEKHLGRVVY